MAATNHNRQYATYRQTSDLSPFYLIEDGINRLPETIKISPPFKKHLQCKWIVVNSDGKLLTGLRPIYKKGVYYGDILNDETGKNSLLIANLFLDKTTGIKTAEIIHFPKHYPNNLQKFVRGTIDRFFND